MQISSSIITSNCVSQGIYTNLEYVKKSLTIYYTNHYWINYLKLWVKHVLNQISSSRSQRNLWRSSSSTAQEVVSKTEQSIEKNSWQPKVLVIRRLRQDCWLMDSTIDIHIYNDLKLMTDFIKKPTNIGGSIAGRVCPGRGTIQIRLALKDKREGIVLNLWNIYYLPNSLFNLVNLSLLNNVNIFYDNEYHRLYNKISQKPLVFTQR